MTSENIKYFKGKNEENVDLDWLRKEMAQYLQIDNLNFLIGAGCSSHIVSDVEKGVPNMQSLYEGFFIDNPDVEIIDEKVNGMFDYNLEKMLEVMGAIQVANQLKTIDSCIDEKIKCVQKYLRNRISMGINSSEVVNFYQEFYIKTARKGRKNPINVFTTNYDLFNEQALDNLGFPYNNGFVGTYKRKFNPVSYKYAFVENMNLSKDVWQRVPSFYNLYKIHGSISWVKRDDQIWEIDYNSVKDDETVMIYPTPLKDRTTLMTPYSDLFRNMENALMRNNSVLIVMGYSFSDDHINRVILNALAIPSFRLIVFGKGSSINKLIELNDSRIIVINSDNKIHYFNNIVQSVMPDLDEDVLEEHEIPSISEIIKRFEGERTNE